jgi:hypothetical protein
MEICSLFVTVESHLDWQNKMKTAFPLIHPFFTHFTFNFLFVLSPLLPAFPFPYLHTCYLLLTNCPFNLTFRLPFLPSLYLLLSVCPFILTFRLSVLLLCLLFTFCLHVHSYVLFGFSLSTLFYFFTFHFCSVLLYTFFFRLPVPFLHSSKPFHFYFLLNLSL